MTSSILTPKAAPMELNTELPLLASPQQVSDLTGVPVSTLAYWRFEGTHLPFCKLGRLVRYRREDVRDFINDNLYSTTSQAKAAR